MTFAEYLALDPEVRREIEVVNGVAVPREPRDEAHQAVVARFVRALAREVGTRPDGPAAL
jgi:hypothetical protein